jgi:hypothetical protein
MCSNSGISIVFDYHWKLLCMAMLGPRDEVFPGRKKSLDVVWWSILPFCPIACPYSLNSLFSLLRIGASLHRQSTVFKVKLDFGTDRVLEV